MISIKLDKLHHEPHPAGPMAGAEACALVAVEEFEKKAKKPGTVEQNLPLYRNHYSLDLARKDWHEKDDVTHSFAYPISAAATGSGLQPEGGFNSRDI